MQVRVPIRQHHILQWWGLATANPIQPTFGAEDNNLKMPTTLQLQNCAKNSGRIPKSLAR